MPALIADPPSLRPEIADVTRAGGGNVVPSFRRTKIIYTLGHGTESEAIVSEMLQHADVVRLNMAHATHDWTRRVIRRIRPRSAPISTRSRCRVFDRLRVI